MDEENNLSKYYSPPATHVISSKSKTKNFFRWIGIIPVAVVALIVSFLLARIMLSFPWWMIGINSNAPIFKIAEIIASGISGYAFVYFGAKIAPQYKTKIAYILTGIVILLGGMAIALNLIQSSYYEAIKSAATAIGGMIMLFQVNSGEADLNESFF